VIAPVAGAGEEDKEQERTVHAGPVKEVGTNEEKEDKDRRCIRRDEQKWEPTR
jgi:hypothetical protein